ncbi:hypothetical protein GCM10018953_59070 [Streptosporangium nondiastaticum]|uniref:hypothetical protein n=1 Tax=Streptosporangium TaxID=2000 RepID=UPI0031F87CB6
MQVDAGDTAAWVSIVVALVFSTIALGVSLVSLKYQREAAKAAKRAVDEAARSADASERSAEAGARSATAAEQVAEIEALRDMRPTVSWNLSKSVGNGYVLRNTGTEVATGVTVDNSSRTMTNAPENMVIPPDASVKFVMEGSLARSTPHEILVSWDGAAEPAIIPVPSR